MTAYREQRRRTFNRAWKPIMATAEQIVGGLPYVPSLRELHYRLIGLHGYENNLNDYNQLSSRTAEARRTDEFPDLADSTRRIRWRDPHPRESLAAYAAGLPDSFGLDLQDGQPQRVVIVVEKRTLVAALEPLGDEFGVPIAALSGYTSTGFVKQVSALSVGWPGFACTPTPTTVLYLGDHDPSGWDIQRDLIERGDLEVVRLGVTPGQVQNFGLTENAGKEGDSRAAGFIERFGSLVQVEVEALAAALPGGLADLVRPEIEARLDLPMLQAQKEHEQAERERLRSQLQGL